MNSLVGYGVSSDSESEEDGDVYNVTASVTGGVRVSGEATVPKRTRNLLLESGSASSESGGGSEQDEEAPEPPQLHPRAVTASTPTSTWQQKPSSPPLNKLPPPPLGACSGSGVFANPFKVQADEKLNALQKHVPLTMQAKPSLIGGKKVCVAYRKDGRCRFGIKCKYAHDSDLQSPTNSRPLVGEEIAESTRVDSQATGSHGGRSQEQGKAENEGPQGKKRRVGLSNTLIPPKRALKQYALQRDKARLNTA